MVDAEVEPAPKAWVIRADGERESLGSFLKRWRTAKELTSGMIATEAQISRQNFQAILADTRLPTMATTVGIFQALSLDVSLSEEPEYDLVVVAGDESVRIRFNLDDAKRAKARELYANATARGVNAGFGGGAAFEMVGGLGFGALVGGPVGAAAGAAAGAALAAARKRRVARKEAGKSLAGGEPSGGNSDEVLAEVEETARSLPTEELEALLEVMREMKRQLDEHAEEPITD